jgi:Fic family protein
MAYIHTKTINDKKYYTLRISTRKNNKVITKDLCNLGNDLSKIKIEDLEKKYKKEIRNSYSKIKKFLELGYYIKKAEKLKLKKDNYLDKKQLVEINAILIHFKKHFSKLDKLTKKELLNNFYLNFAVNSTSLEGNTIGLKEAGRLLQEGILPKNKDLREVYDLTNTKKTIELLEDEKSNLGLNLISKVHDLLLENIDSRKGYRNHEIKIFGQPFKPSPARYVQTDLKLLLDWFEKNKKKIPPLVLAIMFHHKFEKIHPFSDGNGRTGRVIMNYILSSFNYPPLIISRRFREEYLDSINSADSSLKKSLLATDFKGYKKLISFIHSQFVFSYWDMFLV